MGMLKEFKDFAMKGNVIDLAVGVIIGAAFGRVVGSAVDDMLMPPLGKLIGGLDFSELVVPLSSDPANIGISLTQAKEKAIATINYGKFLNVFIQFIIQAFAIFMMVKVINRSKKAPPPADPTTKACSFCCSTIPIKASRCPQCTSELKG